MLSLEQTKRLAKLGYPIIMADNKCSLCGNDRDHSSHIKYGNDVDNGNKHYFEDKIQEYPTEVELLEWLKPLLIDIHLHIKTKEWVILGWHDNEHVFRWCSVNSDFTETLVEAVEMVMGSSLWKT